MSVPVAPLPLSGEDRAELGRLLRSGPARVAERARIVLAYADSAAGNSGVAADLGLSVETVRKWRARFGSSWMNQFERWFAYPSSLFVITLSDTDRAELQRPRGAAYLAATRPGTRPAG